LILRPRKSLYLRYLRREDSKIWCNVWYTHRWCYYNGEHHRTVSFRSKRLFFYCQGGNRLWSFSPDFAPLGVSAFAWLFLDNYSDCCLTCDLFPHSFLSPTNFIRMLSVYTEPVACHQRPPSLGYHQFMNHYNIGFSCVTNYEFSYAKFDWPPTMF
jgi:hypothetical protein